MAFGSTDIDMYYMAWYCYNNPGMTLDMNNGYVRMMCQAPNFVSGNGLGSIVFSTPTTSVQVSLGGAANRPASSSTSTDTVAGTRTFYSRYVWRYLIVDLCGGGGGGGGGSFSAYIAPLGFIQRVGQNGTTGTAGTDSIFYNSSDAFWRPRGGGGAGGTGGTSSDGYSKPAKAAQGTWYGKPDWDGIQGAQNLDLIPGAGTYDNGGGGGSANGGDGRGGDGGNGGRVRMTWLHAKTSVAPEWNVNYTYIVGSGGAGGPAQSINLGLGPSPGAPAGNPGSNGYFWAIWG